MTKVMLPRMCISGTSSGCGKTTVFCAVLAALKRRGVKLSPFKCGPDYIDPMFHEAALGLRGGNLDPFFYDAKTLVALLKEASEGSDLSVLEGAMGFYDGTSFADAKHSCYALCKTLKTPVILVVDAKGMAHSVLALIQGFLAHREDSGIVGVILNKVSKGVAQALKGVIEAAFGGQVKVLGSLPSLPDCAFPSRHLGLLTPAELEGIKDKLSRLADAAEADIDLDGLLELSRQAPALDLVPLDLKGFAYPVRIAIARDAAFCFYYKENLALLEAMGAQLSYFSPIKDKVLPPCDALYLGGGYPELHKEALSANKAMRSTIKVAVDAGLPTLAECGGFMYLTQSIDGSQMVGVLPGACSNQGRLVRFGYLRLEAKKDGMLCRAGEAILAHAFHHYDLEARGEDFLARKDSGKRWACAYHSPTLYAGFPHLPFYANPSFAKAFLEAALAYAKNRAGEGLR